MEKKISLSFKNSFANMQKEITVILINYFNLTISELQYAKY